MLEERLTTAGILAGYLDGMLGNALEEVKNTASSVTGSDAINNLRQQTSILRETLTNLSLFTENVYLVMDKEKLPGVTLLSPRRLPFQFPIIWTSAIRCKMGNQTSPVWFPFRLLLIRLFS